MSVKLLSLNIEGDNHIGKIISLVQNQKSEVVCFNEAYEVDVAGFKHAFSMDAFFMPSEVVEEPNDFRLSPKGKIGTLILSKFPIVSTHVDCYHGDLSILPKLTNETGDCANRMLVWVDVEIQGKLWTFVVTHFSITKKAQVTPLQRENLRKMLSFLSMRKEFVLCGDFNSPRGKEIFDTLANKFTDNIPPEVDTTLDANIHRAGRQIPKLVVDGLFTTRAYHASSVRVLPGFSDHCAIVADIERD